MKLERVIIQDFKSVKYESIEVKSNQLCFVGKNESGKSSLISAISYLNFLDKEFETGLLNKSSINYPNGFPVIVGIFTLSKQDYSVFYNILAEFIPNETLSVLPKNSESCVLQFKRWGNGIKNTSIKIQDTGKVNFDVTEGVSDLAKLYDRFFLELYPLIEYYEKEDLLIEPATIDDLLSDSNKHDTFRKLLALGGCKDFNDLKNSNIDFVTTYLSDVEIKLNSIFKKHYKQDQSIVIRIIQAFGDRLSLIIQDNSNKSFSIHERSPGFQYYFSFLINKLYSKEQRDGRSVILLLDEPGQSLHPKGAKDLLKSFENIADTFQIMYTTHNPFLAVRNNIDSLNFVYKSSSEGTKINKKPFLNKYQVLRKELGIMLNDSFLIGDLNLVVEGSTEKLAFHRIFQMEKFQDLEWMNIYNADGVTNIPQAVNYLGKNNLKLSGIVILDSDPEADQIKAKKSYRDNLKESNWTDLEINSVFSDKNSRTFEDLFPQVEYVEAFNKYCQSLVVLEVFDKDYEDFVIEKPIPTPIINTLSEHFKKFIHADSKSSITKQDVVRNLMDKADEASEKERNQILEKLIKLAEKIKIAFNNIEKHVSN